MGDGTNKVKSLHLLRQMPGVLRRMIDTGRVLYGEKLPVTDAETGDTEQFYMVVCRGEAARAMEEFAELLAKKINEASDQIGMN